MQNEFDWAVNFQETRKGDRQESARIVTIYKVPMTDDRRLGTRISDTEYVEMFVVTPGSLTIQIRVDKGRYWVLSRETLRAASGFDTTRLRSLEEPEFSRARFDFQTEIDSTRYVLQSEF